MKNHDNIKYKHKIIHEQHKAVINTKNSHRKIMDANHKKLMNIIRTSLTRQSHKCKSLKQKHADHEHINEIMRKNEK